MVKLQPTGAWPSLHALQKMMVLSTALCSVLGLFPCPCQESLEAWTSQAARLSLGGRIQLCTQALGCCCCCLMHSHACLLHAPHADTCFTAAAVTCFILPMHNSLHALQKTINLSPEQYTYKGFVFSLFLDPFQNSLGAWTRQADKLNLGKELNVARMPLPAAAVIARFMSR